MLYLSPIDGIRGTLVLVFLRKMLHLGADRGNLAEGGEGPHTRRHDADRDGKKRKTAHLSFSVFGLHIPARPVLRAVELRDLGVKNRNDPFAERFGLFGKGQNNK